MTVSASAAVPSPRAVRRTRVYIGLVAVAAVVLSWFAIRIDPVSARAVDVLAFLVLTVLVATAPLNLFRFPIQLSFNGVLLLMSIPVLGATAAILLTPLGAVLAHRRNPLRATVFNGAMRTCLTAGSALTYFGITDWLGRSSPASLTAAAIGLLLAALALGLINATLVAGVVTLWSRTSYRGQLAVLLTESGPGLVAQAIVAYLVYVLWVLVGLGPASLIFGTPSLWSSRWVLQQYGHRVQARHRTLAALEEAITVRSPGAGQHTAAVAHVCENLAEELAMSADDVDTARTAGTLHDLDVLVAELPTGERRQTRPLAPSGAISQVTFLASALPALSHAAAGFDRTRPVPRTAAILAVADAFVLSRDGDGTVDPAGPERAYAQLRRRSGTDFDPVVVDALGRWLRRSRP